MERNTITALGKLRKGDCFRYAGKNEVWQVFDAIGTRVQINKIFGEGFEFKYPIPTPKERQVIFLRHTTLLPGDTINVELCPASSIIHSTGNIIDEYLLFENIKHNKEIKLLGINGERRMRFIKYGTPVVFVRVSKEVEV